MPSPTMTHVQISVHYSNKHAQCTFLCLSLFLSHCLSLSVTVSPSLVFALRLPTSTADQLQSHQSQLTGRKDAEEDTGAITRAGSHGDTGAVGRLDQGHLRQVLPWPHRGPLVTRLARGSLIQSMSCHTAGKPYTSVSSHLRDARWVLPSHVHVMAQEGEDEAALLYTDMGTAGARGSKRTWKESR